MAQTHPLNILSGTIRLSQDIATLINDRQGSDVQFKVGGGDISTSQESIYDESTTETIYAHSIILRCRSRYFAAMFDDRKKWKESCKGIIYKPNISPSTFRDVLYYIYTGYVRSQKSENIIELIAAAEEMDLDELSIECQARLIRAVQISLSDKDDKDDKDDNSDKDSSEENFEESTEQRLNINVAIRTLIIPALNLANTHTLSHLSQKLLTVLLSRMSVIITSPDAYKVFISEISSEALIKILASDDLVMTERTVWDLALNWACHRVNVTKTTVEEYLRIMDNAEDDNEDSEEGDSGWDEMIVRGDDILEECKSDSSSHLSVSTTQLKQLKTMMEPFLPIIRFSLLEQEDYESMVDTLSYFLSRHRYVKLQRFFLATDYAELLDAPRIKSMEIAEQKIPSKIIFESKIRKLLRKHIFETGAIANCSSLESLKFELLFRASEHGFLAFTFHQRCDNQGPTLTIVRSTDGHLFGGVNFSDWHSHNRCSTNGLNFLFALPDGYHRKDLVIFRIKSQSTALRAASNNYNFGPTFGAGNFGAGNDLYIANNANSNKYSYSKLPTSYDGDGASNTALAGAETFSISDYEVFAISSK